MKDLEARVKALEDKQAEIHHLMFGNLEETGVLPLLKNVAEILIGADGKGGIRKTVERLEKMVIRGIAWVGGAGAVIGLVIWALKQKGVIH